MRLGTAALLVLASLAAVTAGARAAAAPASVPALAREYDEHLLLARPDRGARLGVKGAAARLAPVTRASLDRDVEWLADFRARAATLDRSRLRPDEAALLDSLLARSAGESAEAARGGPLRRDIAAYRTLTDLAVLDVLLAPRVGDCERVRRATRRLRMVPEVLRAAAINLRGVPQAEDAVRRMVESALQSLRTDAPAAAAACRDSRRAADFVEADSTAIRAFQTLPGWLSEIAGETP